MRGGRAAPYVALAAGLVAQGAVLLNQGRQLWFFRDDFSFLLGRSLSRDPVRELMVPHNEHWSTFPVLAFRFMWAVFGLRHYLPYALMPVLLHLATALFLVVLVRGAGAGRWTAVLTGLAFAFLGGGAGAENPLWAFQIGFIGSCLGGVLAFVCLDRADTRLAERWWRGRWFWLGQASMIVCLMCSGMGVPMVVTAAVWALVRAWRRDGLLRGLLRAVQVAILPAAVYGVWFLAWGREVYSSQIAATHVGTPGSAVRAAVHGLGHIWAAATMVGWLGPVMLAVLVAGVAAVWARERLFALGAAGLLGVLFLYLLVGYGRSANGSLTMILHSRYLYVGLVLCTPAVGCTLEACATRLRRLPWAAAGAWVVVGALVIGLGSAETASYGADRREQDPGLRERLIAARAIVMDGTTVLNPIIDPFDHLPNPALKTTTMTNNHGWAKLPDARPSEEAIFNERSVLQVVVGQTPAVGVPAATHVQWVHRGGRPTAVPANCTAGTVSGGRLRLRLGRTGAQVALDITGIDTHAKIRTWIRAGGRSSVERWWQLAGADGRYYVASNLHDAVLNVALPPGGRVGVCGSAG